MSNVNDCGEHRDVKKYAFLLLLSVCRTNNAPEG